MEIDRFLLEFPSRPATKIAYRTFLRLFDAWLQPKSVSLTDLTPADFYEFLSTRRWTGATPYHCAAAVRAYMRWQFGESHPFKALRVYRPDPGPQRTLDEEEATRLVSSIDTTTKAGRRDLPMILLMLDTGLRAREVVGLEIKHLNLKDRLLWVEGKGGKWRQAVYSEMTRTYLQDWLKIRAEVAQPETTTVFISMGGLKPGTALTKDGLRCIFRVLGWTAGLVDLSPHVLRRTFATLAIRAGAPTRLVQVAGGWSSLMMVQRYTQALQPRDFDGYFPTLQLGGKV